MRFYISVQGTLSTQRNVTLIDVCGATEVT